MRLRVLLLAVAGVALVGLVLWQQGEGGPEAPPALTPQGPLQDERAKPSSATVAEEAAEKAERGTVLERAPSELSELGRVGSPGGLRVRVVDAAGEPVVGAPVGLQQLQPASFDWEEMLAEFEQVNAMLEAAKRNPSAAAEMGAQVAEFERQRKELMARLVWAKERDAEQWKGKGKKPGRWKGKQKSLEAKSAEVAARWELRARQITGADGFAVFRDLRDVMAEAEDWWPAEIRDRFAVALRVPLVRPVRVEWTGLASEDMELRMPATGSLSLRTVDRDGRPYQHPVTARIALQGVESPDVSSVELRKEQGEAAVHLPYVGLGLQMTLACRLDDDEFRWEVPVVAGPIAAGEQRETNLVVAPDAGMLHGRLVDGEGDPLAGVRPSFLVTGPRGRVEAEDLTTDRGGRFHLPYRFDRGVQGPFRLEVRRDNVRPTEGASAVLPSLPEAYVTDLGDLVLGAFARISTGRVLDDAGKPVGGARVQLQRQRDLGEDERRLEFVDETFAAVESDASGRYVLFGSLEPGARYRLVATAKRHFPSATDLDAAGASVDLALQRQARLIGTVLVEDWMRDAGFRVQLQSEDDPGSVREEPLLDGETGAALLFDPVLPGRYRLGFRMWHFPDPFLELEGIVVEPGQDGVHPALRDLDLSRHLHRFVVDAVDQDGQPVRVERPMLTEIARPDGSIEFVGLKWGGSRCEFLSARPQAQVRPMATGYVAEPQTLAPGANQITFLRVPPLEVSVPGLRDLIGNEGAELLLRHAGDELPAGLAVWNGESRQMAAWYEKSRYAVGRLDAQGVARLQLMAEGTYQVRLLLGANTGVEPVELELESLPVELPPGRSEPVQATLGFDPAAVDQGIATLTQRRGR